ncbi:WD repeat-containing and planar cell polarity effector protein fritz homolog isoform X2 [Syngnathoides biaculeatus]|uniref:WD repeat-containing and planar cell polarity effector protein fritz homolog isoform X2 n=1 Tax=Syngnathoides biaculeatus TaxID=300417 RepID=UPI002ADD9577|nr:WD repeat-containing and planar cell polarity effector protein fritz homolog isoform X2 [Syngnathoides biaculeatus]XP_061694123.1 WD repeat-containing and planar cell polarity effector protein fritz homolog isoform X2 [Syngnathoides biaculeatus]
MAFCLAELHLWSAKSSLQVQANHQEHHYFNEKVHFTEARGYSWTPANRRPERLRDSLKELEELLQTNTCVHTRWRNTRCCQLLLSSGILVTLTLSGPQLEQVCIDRALAGRLPGDTVTDAVFGDKLLVLSFLKQSQLAVVYLNKKNPESSTDAGRDADKLSPSRIKVTSVEVAGWADRIHQGVAVNRPEDVALCWWRSGEQAEELWPRTPFNVHRNSLVLLGCLPSEGLKVVSSMQTEDDLLVCTFSNLHPYQLLTVEVPAGPQASREASWAKSSVYEYAKGRLHRLSAARVLLPSRPITCSHHPSENLLLLGLSDSSLVLYDQRREVSLRAPCPMPPAIAAWHPAGALVVAAGATQQGELMFLDVGLAPVEVALVAEDATPTATLELGRHVRCPGPLRRLQWAAGPEGGADDPDTIMLVFHGGLLAVLKLQLGAASGFRLDRVQLLRQRLRAGQVREALGVLEAADWSAAAEQCWQGLSAVANHLLRLPLDARTEEQLEAALATFYAPPAPLPDNVTADYKEAVHKYARRFFHHLLRHERLEKAFLLAVDLQDKDLFMDLHYVAGDKGELVLAEVAKAKARQVAAARDGQEINAAINRKDVEGSKEDERGRPSVNAAVFFVFVFFFFAVQVFHLGAPRPRDTPTRPPLTNRCTSEHLQAAAMARRQARPRLPWGLQLLIPIVSSRSKLVQLSLRGPRHQGSERNIQETCYAFVSIFKSVIFHVDITAGGNISSPKSAFEFT